MSVIKNSAIQEGNSLTRNHLTIGSNKVNYGPTSISGFYTGIEPPVGGWVIYRATPAGNLNIFVAHDTTELVDIGNRLTGEVFNSWEESLEYLASQTNYFVLNRQLPSIETDNLLVYLDAGISNSYPRSGYNWYNISDTQYNGVLTNYVGAIPYNDDPPHITFTDSNFEHVSIPNIGNQITWTIEAWFKLNTSLVGKVASIITNQYDLGSKLNFTLGTNRAPSTYKLCVGFFDENGWHNTVGFDPVLNQWYHVVGTYDGFTLKQYVNGIDMGGALTYSNVPSSGGDVLLMRKWDGPDIQDNFIDGDLSIVRIYSEALTSKQVLNNYDAEKSRFLSTYTFSPSTLSWPASAAGYTLYNGGFTNFDDGNSNVAISLPTTFETNNQASTDLYLSTNGYFTLGSGNGGIYSSPQGSPNPALMCGNPSDNWLQPGLVMTDGDTQNAYYKTGTDGPNRYYVKLIVYNGTYGNPTAPRSWLANFYRDDVYQWFETRVKSTGVGTVGPYNNIDVSVNASTTSHVFRGDLSGQNWVYLGTGSVIT